MHGFRWLITWPIHKTSGCTDGQSRHKSYPHTTGCSNKVKKRKFVDHLRQRLCNSEDSPTFWVSRSYLILPVGHIDFICWTRDTTRFEADSAFFVDTFFLLPTGAELGQLSDTTFFRNIFHIMLVTHFSLWFTSLHSKQVRPQDEK